MQTFKRQKNDNGTLDLVFGDDNLIFKGFDDSYQDDKDYLIRNNYRVRLTEIGFAEKWAELVNYEKSFAYIEGGKLYVTIIGLPKYICRKTVEEFFKHDLDQYIESEYGEFFETEPGYPICMVVYKDGKRRIV